MVDEVNGSSARAIAHKGKDGVMVVGADPSYRMFIAAIDKAGNRLWRRAAQVGTAFTVNAAVGRADGGMMVVGSRYAPRGSAVWHVDAVVQLMNRSHLQIERNSRGTDVTALEGNQYAVAAVGINDIGHGQAVALGRVDGSANVRTVRGRKLTAVGTVRMAALPDGDWILAGYRAWYPVYPTSAEPPTSLPASSR